MPEELINRDAVHASLQRLVPHFGPEVLSLPININHEEQGPPAHTDKHGLWIQERVMRDDPLNTHVYVAHEILHHVVKNEALTGQYAHRVVNIAEDYSINWHLAQLFKFDVRRLKIRGIYSKRLGPLPVFKICEMVQKAKQLPPGACGCFGVSHPTIMEVAERFRQRFGVGAADRQPDLIEHSEENRRVYQANLAYHYARMRNPRKIPLDLEPTVKALWLKAYLEDPASTPTPKLLTASDSLVLGWNTREFRARSINQPEVAFMAVRLFLEFCDLHGALLHQRVARLEDRQDRYHELLRDLPAKSKRRRRRYNRLIRNIGPRIEQARKRAEHPLPRILKETPGQASRPNPFSIGVVTLRAQGRKKAEETKRLAKLRGGLLKRELNWISRLTARKLLDLLDFKEETEASLGPFLDELEAPPPPPPLPEGETPSAPEPSEPEGEPPDEEDEDDEGDSEEDAPKDEPEPEPASGDAGEDPGGSAAGNDAGSGGTVSALSVLGEMGPSELQMLTKIMVHMADFDTALTVTRRNNPDEDAVGPQQVPLFGSDIDRVAQSELALLANPETTMLFYSRFADNSLLLLAPAENKRQPIGMALDCSGSMTGERYAIAAAFTLSMMKKLKTDGRGGALTIFSHMANPAFILTEKGAIDMPTLLRTLLKPEYGGTNFDAALLELDRVRVEERWRSVTNILITDGGDVLSDFARDTLLTNKRRNDRLVAVIAGAGGAKGLKGLEDEVIRISRSGFKLQLVRLGKRLL